MKILDRYVISSFLKNYGIALMVLLGLYVVLDMVLNFDKLTDARGYSDATGTTMWDTLATIADYYFYQSFMIFIQLSGIIPVLAAAFTLLKLARFNELSAVMAAGVPLQRVAMPVILVGAIVNLVLLPVNQELVIPQMVPKLMRKVGDLHKGGAANAYTVTGMSDDENRLLSVGKYTPPTEREPAKMELVDVLERDEDWRIVAHTSADSATWDAANGQWVLTNGKRVTGIRPNDRDLKSEPQAAYKSSITPQELAIYRRGQYMDLLSTRQLNEMLARPKSFGVAGLLRVKHMRFTQPLMNVILLLLAIPCILTREPNRLKHAAGLCLAMTGLAMGSVFLCQQMANVNLLGPAWTDKWPALMAWLPILVWGPIAVWLLDRVKT